MLNVKKQKEHTPTPKDLEAMRSKVVETLAYRMAYANLLAKEEGRPIPFPPGIGKDKAKLRKALDELLYGTPSMPKPSSTNEQPNSEPS